MFLEYDLDWLVEREFLLLDGKKYLTLFPIIGKKHYQNIGNLFISTRSEFIDEIIDYLWGHESEIRKIGFYGAHFPLEKLMWGVIELFVSYISRNSPILLKLKKRNEREFHLDGGRYYVIASDISENQEVNIDGYSTPYEWSSYYGIASGGTSSADLENYYWLGVYTFSDIEYYPEIINENNKPAYPLHQHATSQLNKITKFAVSWHE